MRAVLALFALFAWSTSVLAATKKKSVTAHIMFGEIQNYKVEDYVADMLLAREAGIDAFAVNTGQPRGDLKQMDNIFAAAKETGFPLFFSFDMLHYNKRNSSNWILHDYLQRYAYRDEYYKIDGKIVVSTFSGNQAGSFINDVSSFKAANDVWQNIIDTAKTFSPSLDIYFVPFWLARSAVDSSDSADLTLGGVGNWFGFGGVNNKANVTAEPDGRWHDSCAARDIDYWAPVSHSFSVHQVKNNNYVMKGGNWLLATHYRDLIELGDRAPDHIELITFNDWGESTYFSPVRDRANQPHETVDTAVYANEEHDHLPFLWLSAYYSHWFKTGTAPKITSDVIFWWYRGQQTQAAPPNDPLEQPAGWQTLTDTTWVVVLVPEDSKASEVVITSGGKDVETQKVSPGVNLVRGEFQVGKQSISLRDSSGKTLISGTGVDITDSPEWWDYNYHSYIVPSDFRPADFLDISSSGSVASTSVVDKAVVSPTSAATAELSTTSAEAASSTSASNGSSSSKCPEQTHRWRKHRSQHRRTQA
ncbi:uncharacterized protein JCM6883_004912 [Sporobolomyces salmoneus]|uniref:uncharacterized protein n=1 Tax=Sporobolomyces salmoneus TaxID=183962 RepID=UPI00316D272D